MTSRPIYPNVYFSTTRTEDMYFTSISTYLRIQHTDGKWYLQYFHNDFRSKDPLSPQWCVNDFNRNIYLTILKGKVRTELKNHLGWSLFELDENQQTEEERLSE